MKRLPVLALAAALLALVLYGGRAPIRHTIAATEPAGLPAARPVIQAEVNGKTFEGTPGSYCWYSEQGAIACNFVDDPQPTTAISVAEGDKITFQVVGAAGGGAATASAATVTPPADLVAVLLDDQNPDGTQRQTNLTQTQGIFTVENLEPGPHRIAVDALYTAEGSEDQPYVRYVFLLQVGQVVVSAPTTAAGTASASGTPAPTRAATIAATAARTAPPTVATRAVTAAATQAPVITAAATKAPTTAVATAVTATIAPTTSVGVITATQPQTAATRAATRAATTAIPTTSPTTPPVVPTNVPTNTAAPTVVPPTQTPVPPTPTAIPASPTTEVLPTLTASSTPFPLPTVEPMTPTFTATTSAGPAGTPETVIVVVTGTPVTIIVTATPAAGGAVLPEQSVMVGGRRFEPIAVSVCVLGQGGEQICVNRPQNANAERITAAAGDVAQLNFNGPRPTSLIVSLLTAEGNTVINKQTLSPDNLVLYGLPTKPGSYVFSVEVNWPQGKAIYYYRLVIGG